jgi:VWFA-related protein
MRPFKSITVMLLALILSLTMVVGTVAQSSQALVTLNRVESQTFPQVSVLVAVSDEDGPRDGLTSADFQIFEDGVQVSAAAMTVTRDVSQGARLALVLDLSMNRDSLTQVKEAAKDFFDFLKPQDRAAVLAFYDQVRLVQDFTDDKQALIAAIDSLRAEGNMTAFNEAAFEAVTMVSAFPTGFKTVVMVTNSANNLGSRSIEEVMGKAQSAGTSIYVIGFDKIAPDRLEAITTATGGRSFALSNLNQLQASFQSIRELLRQGSYKVTFQSGLQADGAEHNLAIGVAYQGKEGQAQGYFTAVPGQVTVNLPTLADGQTVAGTVDLAVQAIAPAPIASVAYSLNDHLLAEVTTPPYRFEWDTTSLDPGAYRLSVRVVDRAGNQGQVQVTLNIVRPVVVTASTPQTEVKVGDQVPVTVQVESLAEVVRVEFWLDGELVGSSDTPPYPFSLDSNAYPAGEHLMTVRAEDSLGRKAEAELPLYFLATPAPAPKPWWRRLGIGRQDLAIGGTLAATLAILGVNLIGLALTVRGQKRRRQRIYRLEISNLGNVDNRYALRAEDPMGALKFQFAVNGVNLPQCSLVGAGSQPAPAETETLTGEEAGRMIAEGPAPSPAPAPARQGVQQAAGQAMRANSAVASTLSAIGRILPGSVGTSLQQAARPLYRAQSRVSSTTARAQSKIGQAGRLTARVTKEAPHASSARSSRQPELAPASPRAASASPLSSRRRLAGKPAVNRIWFETPLIGSGETLAVDVHIAPLNPHRSQRYAFKVISRAIEPADSPLVAQEGEVQMAGISWLRRLLPYLIFVGVTLMVGLAAMFLLVNLGL